MKATAKRAIVAAEDNVNDAFLLKNAFEEAAPDIDISFVGDGDELISYLEANVTPDLVLLDLKMPRTDGFESLQWIRKQPGLGRLVVVIFTSSGAAEDINRAYDLGANSYLIKPFDHQQLVQMVRKLLTYWLEINQCPNCTPARPTAAAQG